MNPFPALDARLSLIYDLYDPCDLAADIGTDHAYLPAALLQRGRCQKMILTDVSASALANARNEMVRSRLLSRCDLRLGNGLSPLREACGMISVTGMGGRTIRQILLDGQDHLLGASLLLSAHTDWPLIRQTLMDIGYHADREEPCLSGGRFYLVVRARPGFIALTDQEVRLGKLLFTSSSSCLVPFLSRRRSVLEKQLHGLLSSPAHADPLQIAQIRSDLAYYDKQLEEHHDSR